MKAAEVLEYLSELLLGLLEDIQETDDENPFSFRYGAKTACAECLEIIQLWEGAKKLGLDFEIEKRFPL